MAGCSVSFRAAGRPRSETVFDLVPNALLGTRSSAPGQRSLRKKGAQMQHLARWRDPDSNRGHHDFQGRVTGAGKARKGPQIGGSQIADALRRYPWIPLVGPRAKDVAGQLK